MSEEKVYPESRKKAAQWSLNNRTNALNKIIDIFNNSGFFDGLYNIPDIKDDCLTPENLTIGYRSMKFMLEALEEEILLLRYDFMYAIQEASISNKNLQTMIDTMKTKPDETDEQW